MISSFALALLSFQTPTLKVGDPAPPLAVSTWLKGSPVKGFEPGKVYAVEFWATWCGPCKANMPHLSEVAKKLSGKAEVVSVDVWERAGTTEADVVKFVARMGPRMEYRVARDDADGNMSKTWLKAAGRNGIPSAFVVGRDGKIAWIGHPALRMEQVLEAVIADKFDPAAEAAIQAKLEADQKAQTTAVLAYRKAVTAGERDKAEKELAEYVAAHPEVAKDVASSKYQTLLSVDETAAYAYARELATGLYKTEAQGLYLLSVMMSSNPRLKNPDLALARRLAEQGAALPPTDTHPYLVLNLAEVLAKLGEAEKGRAALEKEAERLKADPKANPDAVDAVKAALAKAAK